MEQKFNLSEKVRKELEQRTEKARKAMEKKEKEIQDLKDKLRQAREATIREYRDSDTLLSELGDSFLQGFEQLNNCLLRVLHYFVRHWYLLCLFHGCYEYSSLFFIQSVHYGRPLIFHS